MEVGLGGRTGTSGTWCTKVAVADTGSGGGDGEGGSWEDWVGGGVEFCGVGVGGGGGGAGMCGVGGARLADLDRGRPPPLPPSLYAPSALSRLVPPSNLTRRSSVPSPSFAASDPAAVESGG